ncbi:unnamed protein product [Cunninghamella blakesleeana]
MGLKYRQYLEGKQVYGCSKCHSHLATSDKIIGKEFSGQQGAAYLFQIVVNVDEDKSYEERLMISGTHKISTISCILCSTLLGWKFVSIYRG